MRLIETYLFPDLGGIWHVVYRKPVRLCFVCADEDICRNIVLKYVSQLVKILFESASWGVHAIRDKRLWHSWEGNEQTNKRANEGKDHAG